MDNRTFSVIIGCEHSPVSLRSTLLALEENNAEVIVVDTVGQVERKNVVAEAAGWGMEVWYLHVPHSDKAGAWNAASKNASGTILAFVDDDCIPLPGWLQALEDTFAEGNIGAVGGPDQVPDNAPLFEQCLESVLTSFIGTVGMRSGKQIASYYPRPWNMAVDKKAFVSAGGFDQTMPQAPELPMLRKIEAQGYEIRYQPQAVVWHHRETNLLRFMRRDFRLSMERGKKKSQPGLDKIYGAVCLGLLAAGIASSRRSNSRYVSAVAKSYAALLGASGIQAAARQKSPALAALVPPLMLAHHTAHIGGYMCGKVVGILESKRSKI